MYLLIVWSGTWHSCISCQYVRKCKDPLYLLVNTQMVLILPYISGCISSSITSTSGTAKVQQQQQYSRTYSYVKRNTRTYERQQPLPLVHHDALVYTAVVLLGSSKVKVVRWDAGYAQWIRKKTGVDAGFAHSNTISDLRHVALVNITILSSALCSTGTWEHPRRPEFGPCPMSC